MKLISKLKGIKAKIMLTVLLICGISLTFLGGISAWLNYSSTNATLEQTMIQTAAVAGEQISQELKAYVNVARETGMVARLSGSGTTAEEKKAVIDQRVSTYGFSMGNLLDRGGISVFDGKNYSSDDYFKRALAGEVVVSEPVRNQETGTLSILVAAPVWKDGVVGSTVDGVVCFTPKEGFLNDIVKNIKVSANGAAYIIDKNGSTVAHYNQEMVENANNTTENAKSNPALGVIADLEKKMMNQENGFGVYTYNGVKKFLAYAPIRDANGWSIGINAPTDDFMSETIMGVIITIIILMISMIAGAVITVIIANKIANPIEACAERLDLLARGDLNTPVPTITAQDETGTLSRAAHHLVNGLNTMLGDTDYLLSEMAEGNFNVASQAESSYQGDFTSLLSSIYKINHKLSDTLSQINQAAEQVSSGSDQVSSGAQSLSQGATEQASSIEELAAAITEVSGQISSNAENARSASSKTNTVEVEAAESNRRMQEMLSAMEEISGSSSEIGKIIKTIEDIAFQTNILALNAAVEAARAGAAGKGFAVVADEVRNLASKSAEASKNSSQLIEDSLKAVGKGKKIADETASSLQTVVDGIKNVTVTVDEISEASDRQNQQMSQVTMGIDQISAVVQTNSATAEESAAASEELSGQAQMLKGLVGKFTLNESETIVKF